MQHLHQFVGATTKQVFQNLLMQDYTLCCVSVYIPVPTFSYTVLSFHPIVLLWLYGSIHPRESTRSTWKVTEFIKWNSAWISNSSLYHLHPQKLDNRLWSARWKPIVQRKARLEPAVRTSGFFSPKETGYEFSLGCFRPFLNALDWSDSDCLN